MERKATRPLAPGKITSYLRRTTMPRHVPPFLPPFEARPKIHTVESSPVAQSGDPTLDALAKTLWDRRSTEPLHVIQSTPPPLAPLSRDPEVLVTTPSPAPVDTRPAADIQAAALQAAEDFANDILDLTPSDLSSPEDTDDPFRGITIRRNPLRKKIRWIVYPKGRPKVEVRIIDGLARLRCNGQVKFVELTD